MQTQGRTCLRAEFTVADSLDMAEIGERMVYESLRQMVEVWTCHTQLLAAFVADVLNSQLIPAIVLLNYGTLDVPMPELVFKLPQEGVTLERVQVLKTALEIKGMRIKKSEAYEFMGFAQPAEGDDVFEAASDGGDMAELAGMLAKGKGKPQDDTDPEDDPPKPKKKVKPSTADDAEPVSAARTDAPTDPAQEWLAPIKQKFLEARKAGASMADLKKMLLSMHPNTKALAKAFANNILAGFAGEGEEVDAAKEKLNPPIPQADGTNCHTKNCGRHKGTTREVKTSPLPKKQTKEQDRGNIVYRDNSCHVVQYKDGRMEVHVYSSVTNENDAKKAIEKLISQCREKRKGQMRGKPDFGYIAPGEHVEFFVSSQTINESVENDFHIKRSDNKEAHYTAASVIDKLWETSQEGIRRKPKKDTPKDDEIKWVHERYATLKIRSQKYRVKITAFEYKKSNNDNLLYDIMVQKKR